MDFRELQKNFQVVTEDKLSVGALIITPLSRDEGLKLKPGKETRRKKADYHWGGQRKPYLLRISSG